MSIVKNTWSVSSDGSGLGDVDFANFGVPKTAHFFTSASLAIKLTYSLRNAEGFVGFTENKFGMSRIVCHHYFKTVIKKSCLYW
jgi:hypothetical protein